MSKINVIRIHETEPKDLSEEEILEIKTRLREQVEEKLLNFFQDEVGTERISFLFLYNKIETLVYSLVDNCKSLSGNKTHGVISYLFFSSEIFCSDYGNQIIFNTQLDNNANFETQWYFSRKQRDCAGMIVTNNRNQVLLVYDKKYTLNFPMGKVDHADNGRFKTTALREFKEETGFIWPSFSDLLKVNNNCLIPFVNYRRRRRNEALYTLKRYHRFYYIPNFNYKVDHNFAAYGEIIGSIWVNIDDITSFFQNEELEKEYDEDQVIEDINENKILRIEKVIVPYKKCSYIYKDILYFTIAPSVQNFFMRDSYVRRVILKLKIPDNCEANIDYFLPTDSYKYYENKFNNL